jgi:hypothetical protein
VRFQGGECGDKSLLGYSAVQSRWSTPTSSDIRLMMQAVRTSETSVYSSGTARRCIAQDSRLVTSTYTVTCAQQCKLPVCFRGYAWLSALFINNEIALIGTVTASNNVDGCDSFYSYEGNLEKMSRSVSG